MFGASSNNSGGSGMFGSNTSNNTSGGGLFGAAKPAASSGTGFSFGSNSNQPSTGFGASNTNTNTQSGGGLFGGSNTPASNTTGGGLFGSKPAAPSGGLFGSNNSTTNTSSTGGGLFGSKPAASGGLFGSSNTNNTSNTNTNTSGGLFGSNTSNTSGTTGGGLFGSGNTTNTSGNTGGLFGSGNASNPSGNTGGGLFGSNQQQQQQQQQQQPQQPQPQQPQPSGGLFGQNTTNNSQPSFGWSSQQNNKPALGAANTSNATNNNISLPFNSNNSTTSNVNTYTPAINDQLLKIKEQWDPNSPKCALKTHLYNKFNDQEINMLLSQQRPANESSEDWDAAMSNRPTPQHYPIKITSFTEVAQRVEVQLNHVAKSRILLNTINDRQSALSSKHDLDNTTRILKAKAKHTKLSRRLLRLATILAILRLKGYPLLPEEEEISRQFDLLNDKLNDPNASLGKLNDVFARLAILKERSEELANQFDSSVNTMNGGLNQSSNDISNGEAGKDHVEEKSNDELVNKLTKLLLKQQQGLNYLNEVLQKDFDEVKKISPDK